MLTKAVLMITPFASPNVGGAETHIDKLRIYLNRRQWHVVTATYQPLTTDVVAPISEHGDGFSIYRMPWFGRKGAWFNTLERWPFPFVFAYLFPGLLLVSLYAAWAHRKTITCVHAHGLVASTAALALKTLFGFRIVASTHAIYGLKERPALSRILGWMFQRFDFVLAVGSPSRWELIDYAKIHPDKVDIHQNWVDLSHFCICIKQGGDDIRILFVGRIIEKKGVPQLLEAAKRLPDVRFNLIGDDFDKRVGNVVFWGRISNSHLVSHYNHATATILPSQYEEGFSAVVCESLACGTPVILPKHGVPAYILTDEVAIWIDPTPEGIVDGIKRIRERKIDRKTCRQFAETHFSEHNAEVIERSYSDANTTWL